MQWDVLKLLVIFYPSVIQYSFVYFTVKTKAYNVIISRIVQLWLLFKNIISFCLNSIAEQYNIIAKFGTFFNDPPGIKQNGKNLETDLFFVSLVIYLLCYIHRVRKKGPTVFWP